MRQTREGRRPKNGLVVKSWEISIPKDGYYLAEIGTTIEFDNKEDERDFTRYHSVPLYFEVNIGRVVGFSTSPDPKFTQPTIEDQKEPTENKPIPILLPPDTARPRGIEGALFNSIFPSVTKSYTITVQISGRILYDIFYIEKGVPNIAVRVDWDYDNNPNTGYTPYYGGNTRHVDFDITDNNGYYYFSFYFVSTQPANGYSPRIRIYANNANSAAFDGDLGSGAKFPVFHYIDISSTTTNVYSNTANITVE